MRTVPVISSCHPERSEGSLQSYIPSADCDAFSVDRALGNSDANQLSRDPSVQAGLALSTRLRMTSEGGQHL